MDTVTRAKVDEIIFGRLRMKVAPATRGVLDEALEWAAHLLGATTPNWDRLEALCKDFLTDHPGNVVVLSERRRRITRSVEDAALDAIAAELTALEDRLALTEPKMSARREPKMCAGWEPGILAPRRLRPLLAQAFDAVRTVERRHLRPEECLVRIARHFLEGWKPPPCPPTTLQTRILARDRDRCQAPGCSKAAKQVHHIVSLSAGGSDSAENLTSVCPIHHLRIIHMGHARVSGTAPDGLFWELGTRPGMPSLMAYSPRRLLH